MAVVRGAWPRVLAAVALAVALAGGAGAQSADPAPPAVPDPTRLAPDWWSYFASAPTAELAARAEAFHGRLDVLAADLATAVAGVAPHGLITEIRGLLDALVDARTASPSPSPPPDEPAVGGYRLTELLELAVRRQELELEAELAGTEAREVEAMVSGAKRNIDTAMAAYIAADAAAPGRLATGLAIVRDRLLWALGNEEQRRHREREQRLLAARQRVDAQLSAGRDALVGDAAALEKWSTELAEAAEAQRAADAQAMSVRMRLATLGNDARSQAQRRVQQQLLLNLEAQHLTHELKVAQAQVALDLVQGATGQPPPADLLRQHRDDLQALVERAERNVPVWRRATERERAAAAAQLAAADGVPASILRARTGQVDATSQTLAAMRRQLARAAELTDLASTRLTAQSGSFGDLVAEAGRSALGFWDTLVELGGASLFTINETPVTTFGLVRLTLILVAAWFVSRIVRKGLDRLGRRETMTRAAIYTLSRLFHYVILVIGFLVALSSIGIDFTKFALIASAFGVGLGFGLQAIFSNFVAGLIILFERSLKVGDFVELESGVGGEVQAINIRSTLITTNDNVDILVPNSEFVNGRVTNWTLREAFRRIRVPFGVAYGSDKERVRTAALEAAAEVPHTMMTSGREPRLWLTGFGDSSLDFELVVWLNPDAVKRPATVHADYCWALETALARHGLEIPFPQRDLHLRSVFGRKDGDGMDLLDSRVPPVRPAGDG